MSYGGAGDQGHGRWRLGAVVKVGTLLAVFVASLIVLIVILQRLKVESFIMLPLLVIGGVLCLFIALGLTAVIFATYGLDDKTQALALPEGSIRAVIALSLIILLAILSIYLYGSLSNNASVIEHVSLATRDAMLTNPAYKVIGSVSTGNDFTVQVQSRNDDAVDFAKQLLVLLGTLVTSISSFYFGTRAVVSASSAEAVTGGEMSLASFSPATHEASGEEIPFLLTGEGLTGVKSVKLRQGKTEVDTTALQLHDNNIAGKVFIASDMAAGAWDVVAQYGTGTELTLSGALTITPFTPEAGGPSP
jgi:hypothetical protein